MKLEQFNPLIARIVSHVSYASQHQFPVLVIMVDVDNGEVLIQSNCGSFEDTIKTLDFALEQTRDMHPMTPDMETKGNA